MPAIVATTALGAGSRVVTETTLNGTDSFTFNSTKNPIMILRNPTTGALTATFVGSTATTVAFDGVPSVSIAAGYATTSIAATGVVAVPLNSIKEYLRGTLTITGGTGLVATLLEY
jgi:hypothetical protein